MGSLQFCRYMTCFASGFEEARDFLFLPTHVREVVFQQIHAREVDFFSRFKQGMLFHKGYMKCA